MLPKTTANPFLKNFFHVSFFQLLNSACAFIVNLLVARISGPAEFGNFYFFVSTAMVGTILFDFGLSRTLVRYGAFHHERGEVREKLGYYAAVLKLKTAAGVVVLAAGVTAGLVWGGETRYELVWGLVTAFLVSYGNYLANIALTEEDYLSYNLVLSNNTVRMLIILLLAAASAASVHAIYAVFILSPLLLGLVPAGRLGRELSRAAAAPEEHFYKNLISFGKWMIVLALLDTFYQRLDIILVRHLTDAVQAGYYSGALAFFGIVNLLPGFTAILVYPRFVRAHSRGDQNQLRRDFYFSQRLMAFIAFPMALGLWAVAPELITALLGVQYAASSSLFLYMALSAMGMSLYLNSGGMFFAVDKPQLAVLVVSCALVVNLVGNLVLLPRLGIIGAAMAVCAATMTSVALVWWIIWRIFRFAPNAKHLLVYACAALVMAVTVRALPAGNWGSLVLKIMAGAAVYLGIIWTMDLRFGRGWIPSETSALQERE